jgi:plastocyanin domain-containing protein
MPRHVRLILLGLLVSNVLLAAGCSGGASAPAAPVAVKEISVTVIGGHVTPPAGRIDVAKGQTVRITVRSDVNDVVHVHGFEVSAALMPDKPATVEFVADKTGLYDVEAHVTNLRLMQLAVA